MKLALFDLDNTLIASDSDYLWGEFLCENNYVDAEHYQSEHDRYYQDYLRGELDIDAFLKFQLSPLTSQPLEVLLEWRLHYIENKIKPVLLPKATCLINEHRSQGHELMIITATNRFLTEPIAEILGITNLIACEPEIKDGEYTGNYFDIPSYREGKIKRLEKWLGQQSEPLEESWFYSDSHNDIPLLEYVDYAIAVDGDEKLNEVAKERDWKITSLR